MDQRKRITIPNFGQETLPPRTSNDWTRRRGDEERDSFTSQVLGILNRLAPENLVLLSQKLVDVVRTQPGRSKEMVVAIARKAYSETKFCKTYAQLCVAIEQAVPLFRTMVVGQLQYDANSILDECGQSAESANRHRAFGIVTFLGALYNVKIYPLQKVHELVNALFRAKTRAAIEVQCANSSLLETCELLLSAGGEERE